ncbi:hypothetical protein [Saccharopolyspora sp. 6M]|nr:hypothetical protein [Saccharopolyspora sp. 6M]
MVTDTSTSPEPRRSDRFYRRQERMLDHSVQHDRRLAATVGRP